MRTYLRARRGHAGGCNLRQPPEYADRLIQPQSLLMHPQHFSKTEQRIKTLTPKIFVVVVVYFFLWCGRLDAVEVLEVGPGRQN